MVVLTIQSGGLADIDGALAAILAGPPVTMNFPPNPYFVSYTFGTASVNVNGGGDLTFDANGKLTGGTIIGFQEYNTASADSFSLSGLQLSFAAFSALLGASAGTTDPAAALLAGGNQITLANNTGSAFPTGPGDDTITIASGATTASFDGGAGANAVVFGSLRSDATVAVQVSGGNPLPDTFTVTASGNAYTTVQVNALDVSQLSFIDGAVDADTRSVGGQVAVIFNALLNRPSDAPSLGSFAEVAAKYGVAAVANGILLGAEGQAKDGGLSNAGFVAQIYQGELGRTVDAPSEAYWQAKLDSGAIDRGTFAAAVATAPEALSHSAATLGVTPVFAASPEAIAADRVYQTLTNGLPSATALAATVQTLLSGGTTAQVAAAIIASPAYLAEYGAQDATGFVSSLQQNVYGGPNVALTSGYVAQINGGAATLAQVADAYASSAAAVAKANLLATQSGVAHS